MFWDENNKLIAHNKSAVDFVKSFGYDLKMGGDRFDHSNHMHDNNMISIPKGISKKEYKEKMRESWKQLVGQRTRESNFSDERSILFTDSRLDDGSTISLWTDITENKKGEQSLKLLRDSIEIIPNMLMLWDKENQLIMANEKARTIQKRMGFDLKPGVSRWDMLDAGLKSGSVQTPDGTSPSQWIAKRKKAMVHLTTQETVESVINLNGDVLVILGTSTRLLDGGTLQIWTDITELKKKEQEVVESEKKVRAAEEKISNAINSMPHGITMWDKDMKLLMINDFGNNVWKKGNLDIKIGTSYKEYLELSQNKNFLIFNNKEEENIYYEKAIKNRNKLEGVFTTETPPFYDGSIWQSTSTRLPDGGVFSILSNITDLKQREISLKQLNDAIEITPNAVLLFNKDNYLIMANKTARDSHHNWGFELKPGIHRDEMLDNLYNKGLMVPPNGMTPEEYRKKRKKEIREFKGSEVIEINFTDGTVFISTSTRLDDGGILAVYSDISEIRKQEKQVKEAQELVRQTEQKMSEALNSMPHGISLWDKDDVLERANTLAYNIHKGTGITNYTPGMTFKEQQESQKKYNFFKFDSEEEKETFFKDAIENRKNIKGTKTFETPQFYDGSYWQATVRR